MAPIMIAVPSEYKELAAALKRLVSKVTEAAGHSAVGKAVDYGAVEREVAATTAAVERAAHGIILGSLEVDAARIVVDGVRYCRIGWHPQTYYTLAGPVEITRAIYRQAGVRGGRAIDAISQRAGMVKGTWTPHAARVMAHMVQAGTPREAAACAAEMERLPYVAASFERVAHAVGELYVTHHVTIDDALIAAFPIPANARSVSVELDRLSLPIAEPRPRPRGRPRKGAPKRPIAIVWRQAWVGSVTLHDAEGNALHTIRYGRMPNADPADLLQTMVGDVRALLGRRPDLRVVLLSDGAHDLVAHLAALGESLPVTATQLVDFWHLLEKLAAAAHVLAGNADKTLARWRLHLLNRTWASGDILQELRKSGRRHIRVGEERPVHAAITYIENHRARMNYARARTEGLPIGSGSVEATCKTLVSVRMKRAGSRWHEATGDHVLQLRALALSDRWDAAMQFTLRPLRKSIRIAA